MNESTALKIAIPNKGALSEGAVKLLLAAGENVVDLKAKAADGSYTATTDLFTVFVLAKPVGANSDTQITPPDTDNSDTETTLPDTDDSESDNKDPDTYNPETGDNTVMIGAAASAMLSALALIVLTVKEKKNKGSCGV